MTLEQAECFSTIKKFLSTCRSSDSSIDLRDLAIPDSSTSYNVTDSRKAVSFIINNISIRGICKKEQFGYGRNPNAPYIYGYIFHYVDHNGELGYLAFYKNPIQKQKIKWYIKSLHKDRLDRIENESKEVYWLNEEEIKELDNILSRR